VGAFATDSFGGGAACCFALPLGRGFGCGFGCGCAAWRHRDRKKTHHDTLDDTTRTCASDMLHSRHNEHNKLEKQSYVSLHVSKTYYNKDAQKQTRTTNTQNIYTDTNQTVPNQTCMTHDMHDT
jgi:hypothetical protein